MAVGTAATQLTRHRDAEGPRALVPCAVSARGVYGSCANCLPVKGLQIAHSGDVYCYNSGRPNYRGPNDRHGGEGGEGGRRFGRQGRKRRESRVHFD